MRKALISLLCLMLILTSSACLFGQATQAQPTATEPAKIEPSATTAPSDTPAPTATKVPTDTPVPTATPNLKATQDAEKKAADKATQAAEQTAEAEAAAAQAATVEALNQIVFDQLLKDGSVTRAATSAPTPFDDFQESWAQLGWYQWWNIATAENFVISAHTEWKSASRTADWWNSGCGFTFHIDDQNDHILAYLALDGNVYFSGYVNQQFRTIARGYYGKVDTMEGSADVLLAVDGNKATYYVDGKKVLSKEIPLVNGTGLALTLNSGTNKDFGTECTISQILLWDLDQ